MKTKNLAFALYSCRRECDSEDVVTADRSPVTLERQAEGTRGGQAGSGAAAWSGARSCGHLCPQWAVHEPRLPSLASAMPQPLQDPAKHGAQGPGPPLSPQTEARGVHLPWAGQQEEELGLTVSAGDNTSVSRRGRACRRGACKSRWRRAATRGPGTWDAGGSSPARRKQCCSSLEQALAAPKAAGAAATPTAALQPRQTGSGKATSSQGSQYSYWHPACLGWRRDSSHHLLLLHMGLPGLMMSLFQYK